VGRKLKSFGENKMKFNYNDGGRKEAGYKGDASDCFVRSVCIAGDYSYQHIYDLVNDYCQHERQTKTMRSRSSSRTGVHTKTSKIIFDALGFEWTPTMFIGSGCKVHLREKELPKGVIIARVSKHWCAIIDGVIHDTHNPDRDGTRCVYGYWRKSE
jgi:hypothetical protein